MVLYLFYVLRFSDLELDYACQENVEYKQVAAFVRMWLPLPNYSHVKEN